MAPICCSKFVAQSTTARSVPGLGIDLTGSPMQTWPLPKQHDPPDLWTVPKALVHRKSGEVSHILCLVGVRENHVFEVCGFGRTFGHEGSPSICDGPRPRPSARRYSATTTASETRV